MSEFPCTTRIPLSLLAIEVILPGAEAVTCCSDDDVDARLHRKNSAVEDDVIQPRIVLTDMKEGSCVCVTGSVHVLLTSSGARFVDALSNYLCNPCVNGAVKTNAQNVRPVAQDDHSCPPEDDSTGGIGHFPKPFFSHCPKLLRRLSRLS